MYRRLNERLLLRTLEVLVRRIEERFPDSGLGKVGRELLALGNDAAVNTAWLRRPIWPLRIATYASLVAAGILLVAAIAVLPEFRMEGWSEFFQGTEALVQDVVFLGIAAYFVMTLETRLKRRRALGAIHSLRSLAHIVDAHQLTKDPERLRASRPDTASSPVRDMTREQLGRYLDYCSELLSLTSKLAALYVQDFNDPVVLGAVSEVETLCGGLAGKIWQKITMLDPSRGLPAANGPGDS
jgi:hypothetical protein